MTTPATRAGLDNRVTSEDGQPVASRKVMRWFTITRADGPAGVLLTARIPGYLDEASAHPAQAAAMRAAHRIYAGYREDVRALSYSDRSDNQQED
jgi:hypothetical protein